MRLALALAILLIPLSSPAQEGTASITGAIVDMTGAFIPHATVDLVSATKKYQVHADDTGVYQFSNLPPGAYTLAFYALAFRQVTVKSIMLSEREQKRIPEITLMVGYPCGVQFDVRDFVRLLPVGIPFGVLSGSVVPPVEGVEATLVCRTFNACASTKTDSTGHFSFDMLSPGLYGLNFRGKGFYPESATGYGYYVNAGLESIYRPVQLERCPNGNCNPKLRPAKPPAICE